MIVKTIKNIFQSILFQHILFWATVAFLLLLPDINKDELSSVQVILQNATTLLFLAVAVYINLLFLIPRYLRKKQFAYFVLFQFLNISLFIVLDVFTGKHFFNYDYIKTFDSDIPNSIRYLVLFLSEALLVSFFIAITTFVKLLRDWMNMQDNALKLKEMERQKLEVELQSLKSQINPHFLFNTLNNIYALALDESDKTPDMILKLSDLMRYIIYDCRSAKVKLSKEIEFIRNYIALEQLRLDGKIRVDFNVEIEYEIELPPLIFVNFLENAFKHATKTDGSFILLNISVNPKGEMLFYVENSKEEDSQEEMGEYSGVGLQNVKKRLMLLFPHRHELNIQNFSNKFSVNLKLKTDES